MENESPQATAEPVELSDTDGKPFPWMEIISAVWFHRKLIAIFIVVLTILAVGITFLIHPRYTVYTSVLRELTKEKTLGLARLSSVAEAAGLNIGETPVSKLYPMVVKSEFFRRQGRGKRPSSLSVRTVDFLAYIDEKNKFNR